MHKQRLYNEIEITFSHEKNGIFKFIDYSRLDQIYAYLGPVIFTRDKKPITYHWKTDQLHGTTTILLRAKRKIPPRLISDILFRMVFDGIILSYTFTQQREEWANMAYDILPIYAVYHIKYPGFDTATWYYHCDDHVDTIDNSRNLDLAVKAMTYEMMEEERKEIRNDKRALQDDRI